jgi:signal transduction histidine kinase
VMCLIFIPAAGRGARPPPPPARKIGESAALISHEIKNYASVMKHNHSLLRSKIGGESHTELERIRRSAEKIESFARSLVEYSGSAKSGPERALCLAGLMEDCARAHFPQPGLVRIRRGADEASIRGEAAQLERVFLNLWKNSMEANATRIECHILAGDGRIAIAMEDDGEGCDDRDLQRIGTPFFTTKRQAGGAGLGTAITLSILQAHGGRIRFERAGSLIPDSRGLRVVLDFPQCA